MKTDNLKNNISAWKDLAVKYRHERERIYKEMSRVPLAVLAETLKINGCDHLMDYCDLAARRAIFGGSDV